MQKMLKVFIIIPTLIIAAYNPFFNDNNAPKQKVQQSKLVTQQNTPTRKDAEIRYFGFIESNKGKFALISFREKNIVIKKDDSLYFDEQIFKVLKISSNYILINDRYNRPQTVYFSSESKNSNDNNKQQQ